MDHIVCRVYDPVRSSIAAFISEFAFITYDAYIRLNIVLIVLIKKNGKWGQDRLRRSRFSF